ncbi:GNAT family N-acetyltransferase [Nocardioides yefusunii]|uniref:GNAT family N-acetyltransferase n=1 Tax=Nocardioides yefusunii TaxID=2500546 RepID=A0ABW1R0H8_9ACTN|nr:GNAT family N-acetyltransferase [Nocardioides yefusunii]
MCSTPHRYRTVPRALDHADAARLVDEVQAEYAQLYGTPDEAPIDVAEFAEGNGRFFVLYLEDGVGDSSGADGEPVATGAWRWIDAPASLAAVGATRVAELKRMYVRAEHRRQGLARRVLAEVEADAMRAGVTHLVLETGLLQQPAIAMYRAAGYVDLAGFGHYVESGLSVALWRQVAESDDATGGVRTSGNS